MTYKENFEGLIEFIKACYEAEVFQNDTINDHYSGHMTSNDVIKINGQCFKMKQREVGLPYVVEPSPEFEKIKKDKKNKQRYFIEKLKKDEIVPDIMECLVNKKKIDFDYLIAIIDIYTDWGAFTLEDKHIVVQELLFLAERLNLRR